FEFWYEFGSTYSYPPAMRIDHLAAKAGVEVRWRPFLLGPILQTLGWNDSPFNIFAAKGRYMWRDRAGACQAEGLPLRLPPVKFPQNGLKAARIALALCSRRTTPSRRTSARMRHFFRSLIGSASKAKPRSSRQMRRKTRMRPSPSARNC